MLLAILRSIASGNNSTKVSSIEAFSVLNLMCNSIDIGTAWLGIEACVAYTFCIHVAIQMCI